jgi:hypothetical protein
MADIRTMDFIDGEVVDCSGFVGLLLPLGVEGDFSDRLVDVVDAGVEQGHDKQLVLETATRSLGTWLVQHSVDADLIVQYAPEAPTPERALLSPISALQMVVAGVHESRSEDWIREWIEENESRIPEVCAPDDRPRDEWGLGAMELGMLGAIERSQDMGDVVTICALNWESVTVLVELGLVGARDGTVPDASPDPPAASRFMDEEPTEKIRRSPPPAGASGARPKKRRGVSGRKFLPVDAKVALDRVPWQSVPDLIETHLSEAYRALNESPAEVVLGLETTADLSGEVIEARFRDRCTRYHPDRYLGANQAVRSLAQGCFSRVADAHQQARLPEYLERLNARYIYAETGKRPVNDRTRTKARVEFKKAEMLFRQRRFSEAAKLTARAQEGDPDRHEYAVLFLRSSWSANEMGTEDVVAAILGLEGLDAADMGEAYYQAGEMLLKDGRKREAQSMFKKAVEIAPDNIGARRRIRLGELRTSASAEKDKAEKGGVFGGLFGRRKR